MQLSRPGLAAELLLVHLCLAGLGGTAALVIETERRHAEEVRAKNQPAPVVVVSRPAPKPTPPAPPAPKPAPPAPKPLPVPEDPTPKALAQIDKATAEQKQEAARLAKEIRDRESLLKTAEAEAEKWRGSVVDRQALLFSLNTKAERFEMEAAKASIEVDVLERARDEKKSELKQSEGRSSYAILPNKGPNGTWRRPIVIECDNGQVALMPKGPSFGLAELLEIPGFGNSSFRSAVAREAVRIQRGATPDGRIVVPYFFFLIRPDGIKSYYAARRQLEPLGIAFGYELADSDWEIDYPDLDDPDTWTGQAPGGDASGLPGAGGSPGGDGGPGGPDIGGDNPFVWPAGPAGSGDGRVAGGLGPFPDGPVGPLDAGDQRGMKGPGGGLAGSERAQPGGALPSGGNSPELLAVGAGGDGTDGDLTERRPGGPAGRPPQGGSGGVARTPVGSPGGMSRPGGDLPELIPDDSVGRDIPLPKALGEEVASMSPFEKTWAETLARRGLAGNRIGGQGTEGDGQGGDSGRQTPGGQGGGGSQSKPGQGTGEGGQADGSPPGSDGPGGGGGTDLGAGRVEGMELVIACESRGVVIHPGDYRVTIKGLSGKDPLLSSQLRALYKAQKDRSPGKVLVPRIRFVVEPGGQATFAKARIQIALDGIDWPTSVQISGGDVIRGLSREDW